MENSRIEVICGDGTQLIADGVNAMKDRGLTPIVVTDPPFNTNYKYRTYVDKMPENAYFRMLADITNEVSSAVVLYPEALHRLSIEKDEAPKRVISWTYNANTPRQHRDIAYYGVMPDFKRVPQPYKNQNDKRIKALMAQGRYARSYDWIHISQVKNVSHDKTVHPCQMPIEVMKLVIGVLPDNIGVIDPFCGSGTTGIACRDLNIDFIGYEIDPVYCEIAHKRITGFES